MRDVDLSKLVFLSIVAAGTGGCSSTPAAATDVSLERVATASASSADGPAPDGTEPRRARPSPTDSVAARPPAPPHDAELSGDAELLFLEGRDLFNAGQFASACPKFEQSNALDPAAGTLLNLARCREMLKDTQGACESLAAVLPMVRSRDAREQYVRETAKRLGCPLP